MTVMVVRKVEPQAIVRLRSVGESKYWSLMVLRNYYFSLVISINSNIWIPVPSNHIIIITNKIKK